MRLRYYDKHGAEIQVGMLLRHDGGAIERVLELSLIHISEPTRRS